MNLYRLIKTILNRLITDINQKKKRCECIKFKGICTIYKISYKNNNDQILKKYNRKKILEEFFFLLEYLNYDNHFNIDILQKFIFKINQYINSIEILLNSISFNILNISFESEYKMSKDLFILLQYLVNSIKEKNNLYNKNIFELSLSLNNLIFTKYSYLKPIKKSIKVTLYLYIKFLINMYIRDLKKNIIDDSVLLSLQNSHYYLITNWYFCCYEYKFKHISIKMLKIFIYEFNNFFKKSLNIVIFNDILKILEIIIDLIDKNIKLKKSTIINLNEENNYLFENIDILYKKTNNILFKKYKNEYKKFD